MKYTARFVEWISYIAGPVEANSPEEAQAIIEQAICDGEKNFQIVAKDNGFEEWEITEMLTHSTLCYALFICAGECKN